MGSGDAQMQYWWMTLRLRGLVPRFQNESWWITFLTKISLLCMKMNMQEKHMFTWMVPHQDSIWHRGKRQFEMVYYQATVSPLLFIYQNIFSPYRFYTFSDMLVTRIKTSITLWRVCLCASGVWLGIFRGYSSSLLLAAQELWFQYWGKHHIEYLDLL